MTTKRELRFVSPDLDSFLGVLEQLWAGGPTLTRLVGENRLSAEIEQAGYRRHISFARNDVPADGSSSASNLIVITETDGEKLGNALLTCIDLDNVTIIAPVTDWHFSRKPLFLVSIPKAGTHLLYELAQALGYQSGVELPENPVAQTWYCLEYSNSHTVAKDFFVDTVRRSPFGNRHHPFPRSPTLFIYRHPLDILVSEALYYRRDGKSVFAAAFDGLDFDACVTHIVQDDWLLGSFRKRIGGFLPWLDFPNVISLSFEELIGADGGGDAQVQLDVIWSIMLRLQAPGIDASIAARVFNRNSPTFREGQSGGYVKQLSPAFIEHFASRNADLLGQFGYPEDGAPALPRSGDARRKRALRYSTTDFDDMPLTIESGYLGCNLVRYRKQVYAVPMAVGPISIGKLAPEALAGLPVANTVAALKSLLLIGRPDFNERLNDLERLATTLRESSSTAPFRGYWSDSAAPDVIGEYQEFNLVAWDRHYVGLRQTMGPVDVSGDFDSIANNNAPGDVLIASSLAALRSNIDLCRQIDTTRSTNDQQVLSLRQQLLDTAKLAELSDREVTTKLAQISDEQSDAAQRFDEFHERLHAADGRVQEVGNQYTALRTQVGENIQNLRQQMSDVDERISHSDDRLRELHEGLDVARSEAVSRYRTTEQNILNLQQQATVAREHIVETLDGLQNISKRLDTVHLDAIEKHRALFDQAKEFTTRLDQASMRADETDRLFNELLKYFDRERTEAEARHTLMLSRCDELLKRIDEEKIETRSQFGLLDAHLGDLRQQFTAHQVAARSEQDRVQTRLDDLQQQSDTLSHNLFVRIGRKIGRLFDRRTRHD